MKPIITEEMVADANAALDLELARHMARCLKVEYLESMGATEIIAKLEKLPPCFWCGTVAGQAAMRGEGPHSTRCVRFRPNWAET